MFNQIRAFALLALVVSPSAFAEGIYFGAGATTNRIEESAGGINFDDTSTGWRVLGGYEFNENFAIEAAYTDMGEAEDSVLGVDVTTEVDGATISAVGILPLDQAWVLFAKVGYFDGEAEVSVLGISASEDDSGTTAGIGLSYNLSDSFRVRAEYDWFDTELETLSSVGITLQYTFSMR